MSGLPFIRPRLLMSRCLELEPCRYNGERIRSRVVRVLEPHVELVPVCPEVEIGLGVPRPPIRLVESSAETGGGRPRLVQPSTGRDLTERMSRWARAFADDAGPVDGVLLKSRSPSCGVTDAKWFADPSSSSPLGVVAGAFAREVLERYPETAATDEIRLLEPSRAHHFLTRLFAAARLRSAAASGLPALMRFHTAYKLVLMAHSPRGQRELGRLLAAAADEASTGRGSGEEARARSYCGGVSEVLRKPATRGGHINAVEHAQGYFKTQVSGAEKQRFAELRTRYVAGEVPLRALLDVLEGWAARHDDGYVRDQAYLRPHPAALDSLSSGE